MYGASLHTSWSKARFAGAPPTRFTSLPRPRWRKMSMKKSLSSALTYPTAQIAAARELAYTCGTP